jgi:hypothetical protein
MVLVWTKHAPMFATLTVCATTNSSRCAWKAAQVRAHKNLRDWGEQVLPHEMKGRSHDVVRPGGLGLFLIRNAFDEVDYVHKRRGTELVLTKNLE